MRFLLQYGVEQGAARIGIAALDGGEIVAWQPEGGSGSDALYHHERGFLGRFSLNSPEQVAGPYPFELQSIMEKNGIPAVCFSYTVPDFANASAVKNPLAASGEARNKRSFFGTPGT